MSDHDEGGWGQEAPAARLEALGMRAVSLIHELRQPLFALKATVQLGARGGGGLGPEQVREVLARVAELEELLEVHGPPTERPTASFPFDLNGPVQRAVQVLAAQRQGVELELHLAPERLWVTGRPGAVRQVMINLLSNAFDAVQGQASAVVRVHSSLVEGRVQVIIEDTGPGIPPELRRQLFEPFITTKPPGQGSGLGLYIARELVHEAQGTLRLSCPDTGGTRVEVELPASIDAASPHSRQTGS